MSDPRRATINTLRARLDKLEDALGKPALCKHEYDVTLYNAYRRAFQSMRDVIHNFGGRAENLRDE